MDGSSGEGKGEKGGERRGGGRRSLGEEGATNKTMSNLHNPCKGSVTVFLLIYFYIPYIPSTFPIDSLIKERLLIRILT